MKTYVFDLDGTVCTLSDSNYYTAQPYKNRIKIINDLYEQGNKIILLTARGMGRTNNNQTKAHNLFYDLTVKQLDEWAKNLPLSRMYVVYKRRMHVKKSYQLPLFAVKKYNETYDNKYITMMEKNLKESEDVIEYFHSLPIKIKFYGVGRGESLCAFKYNITEALSFSFFKPA